MAHARIT